MSAEEMTIKGTSHSDKLVPFRPLKEADDHDHAERTGMEFPDVCPTTQRVILVSPHPGGIHELVRDLSEGCFDILVFHHWEQGIRNAQAADLLMYDLTSFRNPEEAAQMASRVQEIGDTPALLLVNELMISRMDQTFMNQELMIWPARPGEVVYHAQRIIRNGSKRAPASRLLTGTSPAIYKDLWIDRKKMAVYRDGAIIDLTKTEYELLLKLLEQEGAVLSREELLAEVWGTSFLGGSNVVDVHIKTLRKKLGDKAVHSKYIATVRGVGYRLAD